MPVIKGTIKLSRPQTAVWRTPKPLNLEMAGQRAGKSQMIGILSGRYVNAYPKAKGFIAANTYLQFTQSTFVKVTEIWRDLWGMTEYSLKSNPLGHYVVDKRPPAHFKRFETYKDYNNIVSFWNGAVVFIGSLENYKAHDGKEFAWAHLDETKDTREEAITTVILARLSQRGLWVNADGALEWREPYDENTSGSPFNPCWIHTSPAVGQVEWLTRMFELDEHEEEILDTITRTLPNGKPDFYTRDTDKKRVVIYSTYHNEENLPANYIEQRKAILTENEQLKFIYGYPFSKTGGEYFPAFNRIQHVGPTAFDTGVPNIHITWDFNVMPYLTAICSQVDHYEDADTGLQHMRISVYREYCYATPRNTIDHIGNQIMADHPEGTMCFLYGDSTGRNRIPGLGSLTAFKQIEQVLAPMIHNATMRAGRKNINPLVRRDMMNKIFEGKVPIEIVIDPSCKQTIRDFEYLKLAADGKLKEKAKDPQTGATYEKIGHTSDALEYQICELVKPFFREADLMAQMEELENE